MDQELIKARMRHAERRRVRQRVGSRRRRPRRALPPFLLSNVKNRRRSTGIRLPHYLMIGVGLFSLLFILSVVSFTIGSVAAAGATVRQYREVNDTLPNAGQVAAKSFRTSTILDRNGVTLQTVDQKEGGYRSFVPLDQISPYLIQATIASEDATYWSHYGVEPIAIFRGAVINVSGSGSSGGSTITQQLARGLFPEEIGTEYSVQRKVREAMAAVAIEKEFSKQDIMTMYLNLIFYGQRSYGIEAASQTFFGVSAKDLDLAQASMLAGLPQAPSAYDPTIYFDMAKARQKYVLSQMVKYDYVSQETADKAFKQRLRPQQPDGTIQEGAEHFTIWVKQYIEETWPGLLVGGGVKITTSLDLELQRESQALVSSQIDSNLRGSQRNNAAMLAMVPWSGQILAMVGSDDFNDPFIGGQNNYTVSPLQPGSSIKPLVFAAAFEKGWNPGTVVMDGYYKEDVPDAPNPEDRIWEPNNYSQQFYGAVSVRTALSNSLNIPAIKAAKFAGVDHAIDLAQRMGITSTLVETPGWYGNSFALGTAEVTLLEHTNAYATLANNGQYVKYNPILKIEDSQGNVLYDVERDKPWEGAPRAIKAAYAYQITSILTDNKARELIFGPGNLFENTGRELGRPVAAKSGTTDDWKDIWTMGYTTDLAVGVWAGYSTADGSGIANLSQMDGIQGAGPIWQAMMYKMHREERWSKYLRGEDGTRIAEQFRRPSDIYDGRVCAATGNQASDGFEGRQEVLVRNEGPALPCNQLSAYQDKELDAALEDIRRNGGRYTGGGVGSVQRYADAVRGTGTGSFSNAPGTATGGVDTTTGGGGGDNLPIQDTGDGYIASDDEEPIIPVDE